MQFPSECCPSACVHFCADVYRPKFFQEVTTSAASIAWQLVILYFICLLNCMLCSGATRAFTMFRGIVIVCTECSITVMTFAWRSFRQLQFLSCVTVPLVNAKYTTSCIGLTTFLFQQCYVPASVPQNFILILEPVLPLCYLCWYLVCSPLTVHRRVAFLSPVFFTLCKYCISLWVHCSLYLYSNFQTVHTHTHMCTCTHNSFKKESFRYLFWMNAEF